MHSISFSVEASVCTITLNRPGKRNAVNGPMAAELRAAFERFEADDALRVAILTGAGGNFCAGADLGAIADPTCATNSTPMAAAAARWDRPAWP